VTWLGSGYVLAPATILLCAAFAARRQRAAAHLLCLSYFGASLSTWLLKRVVARERPMLHPALLQIDPADASFPSGHATHAAAFALGLWLVAARQRPRWRTPAAVGLIALVLLVSASRLYLQVHWPSDVLAGLLVAALWAALALARAPLNPARGGTA
jgi:undecaprenyl-diphosphatase